MGAVDRIDCTTFFRSRLNRRLPRSCSDERGNQQLTLL